MSEEHGEVGDEKRRAVELFDKTEARVRHIGYVVLFGTMLLVTIPMIVAAVQGIQQDEIRDPFTGEPTASDEVDVDCTDEAAVLARETGELDGDWERRFRRWNQRCGEEHESLYQLLERVRDDLRGARPLPESGEAADDQ